MLHARLRPLAGLFLLATAAPSFSVATAQTRNAPPAQMTISVENIVDLTHTLTPETPFNPTVGYYFPFRATQMTRIEDTGSNARRWEIHEHLGTQIDAPIHFQKGGATLDQLPINTFIAPLAVIDIRERARRSPDALLTVDDIRAWERRHGRLPRGAAVFMWSGWDAKYQDAKAYANLDSAGTMHFPGWSIEAIRFLLRERDVVGIGNDTMSPDVGPSKDFPVHKAWHAAGKWNLETVANLGRVPAAGATVIVAPTKVGDATGGPVRIIATYPSTSASR